MDTKTDLHRFDDQVRAIEQDLQAKPPIPGGILLYGSSTMANWRAEDLCHRQLAPLPVTNTGFGGSTSEEALYYYHQLVRPVRPSVMAYYEGANDLQNHYTADDVIAMTHRLFEWCRQDFPGIRFVIIPIKLSPGLNISFPEGQRCNRLFADYAQAHDDTSIIDVDPLLYDEAGEHRMEIYVEDKLHHNPYGYEILASLLKPELEKQFHSQSYVCI